MLSISVLGPVEVRRAGQPISIPAGKTSEILVRLALEAGTPVRTDRLVEDLWGEDSVGTSRNTVQSKIAKLRRALGDPSVIVGGDGGYTLVVDTADVDALRAPTKAAEAAVLLDSGDNHGAAQICARTLQMFRGEVLPTAGDGDWVIPHRARLDAARMQLIETGCTARLRLGDTNDVIGDLELAVTLSPYQESLWVLLITALYQAGRQTDALATYQRVRHRLADDLGLDPGPQLQQLEQQILNHDRTIEPSPRSTPLVTGNLLRSPQSSSVATMSSLPSPRYSPTTASSRSSVQAASAKPHSRSRSDVHRPHHRVLGEVACGWRDSKPPSRPTTSSTR